jgi:hypothetical protein
MAKIRYLTDGLGKHYRVHFLNLKPLVCILISMGSTWDIGTKYWYVLPKGVESCMCILTMPTSSTIDTMLKVEGRIKQRRDFLTTENPDIPDTTHSVPIIPCTMTLLPPPPPPPVHIATFIFCRHRLHRCSYPPPPPCSL